MSQQLLLAARDQAERSESAVRAPALMHISRVLASSDQVVAELNVSCTNRCRALENDCTNCTSAAYWRLPPA